MTEASMHDRGSVWQSCTEVLCGQGVGIDWSDQAHLERADPYYIWQDITTTFKPPEVSEDLSAWVAVLVELKIPWGTEDGFSDFLKKLHQAMQVPAAAIPLPQVHLRNFWPDWNLRGARDLKVLAFPTNFDNYLNRRFVPLIAQRDAAKFFFMAAGRDLLGIDRAEYGEAANIDRDGRRGAQLLFWRNLFIQAQNQRARDGLRPLDKIPWPPSQTLGNVKQRSYSEILSLQQKATCQPLVMVVDDHSNFASPRLWRHGQPVVLSVWHQSDDPRVYRRLDENRHEGGLWTSASLLDLVKKTPPQYYSATGSLLGRHINFLSQEVGKWATGFPEAEAYKYSGYIPVAMRWSHGSAVVEAVVNGVGMRHRASEPLPAYSLMFTQLPSPTVADTSGGSLAGMVLDAIHDGLEVAKLAGQRNLIVNVSYGTYAGPHDGSSMIERALLALLKDHLNLHVVLPAGNSHLSRTHSARWVYPGQTVVQRWKVQPDNAAESFVQVWLSTGAGMSVSLVSPEEDASPAVQAGQIMLRLDDKQPTAGVVFAKSVAQGLNGTMVLMAVSRTRKTLPEKELQDDSRLAELVQLPRTLAPAPSGVWQVRITNHGTESVHCASWIQRGDNAPGRVRAASGHTGRQGVFLDALTANWRGSLDKEVFAGPEPSGTLNGIATLKVDHSDRGRLCVVGASRSSDGELSTYSSAGPNRLEPSRCEGPDVVVPADETLALPGVLTGGMMGSTRVRVAGTSIAAAVLTHQLYNHLASSPCATAALFADQMCFQRQATRRPVVPAGAPEHADAIQRGDRRRLPA